MKHAAALIAAALAALNLVAPAHAQQGSAQDNATRVFSLGELIGLDPRGVRAKLMDAPVDWPITPALETASANGEVSLIPVEDMLTDPILTDTVERLSAGQGPIAIPAHISCNQGLETDGDPNSTDNSAVLMFRNGGLEAVYRHKPSPPAPMYRGTPPTPKEWIENARRPRPTPFIAQPGDLPLDDGLGFLARWNEILVPPSAKLHVSCVAKLAQSPPTVRGHGDGSHQLTASDMQGLALAPFAISLPFLNGQRTSAREQGPKLLASLHLGEDLPGGPERFAADHSGVRVLRGPQPDYVVLSIDLGSYASRNLSNINRAAMVGVRGPRIEWIARTGGIGLTANLLCLDQNSVPGRVRSGCQTYGAFNP